MTKAQFRALLVKKQNSVQYSEHDEGAHEFYAELQGIIDAIDNGGDVQAACDNVGETNLITEAA